MAGELNLTALLHRKVYLAMPTPQQAYLLLAAMPTENIPGTASQSVNLCLVLDRSGSMAGEKLHYLKEAAKILVDRLSEKDLLSVVVFDDEDPADLIVPSGHVMDHDKVKKRIDAIQERGGTHMSTGMKLGLEELQKGRSPDRVSSMLLLTDGQTWEDEVMCRDLADSSQEAGIPIHVFGLGIGAESNWDPVLLEDLARRSGGEWVVVDEPVKVGEVFAKTLASVQGTAVTNAYLTMRMVEGVVPRFVWRVVPLISRLDHRAVSGHDIQVFLGDLQHNVGQTVLADLLIPSYQAGTHRLIQADISYDVPGLGLVAEKTSLDVMVQFVDDAAQSNETDGSIMNVVERVVAHKLQTQALDEAAAGEAVKATQRLRAAATRLLNLGEVDLAEQANEQAKKIEEDGQIDIASAQKMRYATKRLTEIESLE